ncbi:hypothetical protein D047_3350A, partial [Vibrio parahaemolyticus VPTS-2010_2]
MQNVVP